MNAEQKPSQADRNPLDHLKEKEKEWKVPFGLEIPRWLVLGVIALIVAAALVAAGAVGFALIGRRCADSQACPRTNPTLIALVVGTPTHTPTATPTFTVTPTPTHTPLPTDTPTPTWTPTSTPTPTPPAPQPTGNIDCEVTLIGLGDDPLVAGSEGQPVRLEPVQGDPLEFGASWRLKPAGSNLCSNYAELGYRVDARGVQPPFQMNANEFRLTEHDGVVVANVVFWVSDIEASTDATITEFQLSWLADPERPERLESFEPVASLTLRLQWEMLPPVTPTPTPTLTHTPSPSLTPVAPTSVALPTTDTPQPGLRAPQLLRPNYGDRFDGLNVELAWHWEGELKRNQYFDVRVWRDGQEHYGVHWTKEQHWTLDPSKVDRLKGTGEETQFYWQIAVIRGRYEGSKGIVDKILAESEERAFIWKAKGGGDGGGGSGGNPLEP